jgi:hypothetical protein
MADEVLLYISAAPDLQREREILGRAVTEVPVTLGWRVVQSPSGDAPADLEAAARADVHLLLLGSDIQAPVGREWIAARRAGRRPVPLLKRGVLQTPAAQSSQRYVEEQVAWRPFRDGAELRLLGLKLLADHILARAQHYALSPLELARLQDWRSELDMPGKGVAEVIRGGAAASGIVLSPERYVPSEGVLLQAPEEEGGHGQEEERSGREP